MRGPLVAVGWSLREPPLAPSAVVGFGPVAVALGRSALGRPDEALARLLGVAGEGVLLLLGEASALPWADGAVYLGREPGAPRLLVPTFLRPGVPAALLERALGARAGAPPGPLAIVLDPPRILPAGEARRVSRGLLAALVEGGLGGPGRGAG